MSRRLLLLGLAFCCIAHADAQPRIDLTLTPAWKGWSRPGRTTEIDVRVASDTAMRTTVELTAARQSTTATLDLQPGRVARLQIAVDASPSVAVRVDMPSGAPLQRDLAISQSEAPLLGVGLAFDERVQLDGFHALALTADDLPRNESAYSSIDALIVDAPTLAGLDQRQLAALVGYATSCGRLVVVDADARVRGLLDGAGGCRGRAVMNAKTAADARTMLLASLATRLPQPLAFSSVGTLARPAHAAWSWVAVILAVYFAVAALALIQSSSLTCSW